jgi:quercetin dioxygenase-like cupin family protein
MRDAIASENGAPPGSGDGMKTVQASPEEMEARTARFEKLGLWGVQRNPKLPQEARDLVYARKLLAITSPREAEGPLANSAPIRDVDFTFHIAECPPGQGPGLHAHHATTETFFCLDGRYRIYWGDEGEHEVILEQWDTVSVPPGVVRGFQNVSDDVAHLLILVTGGVSDMNDIAMTPEYRVKLAAFGPEVVPELEKTGLRFDAGVDA